jgi:imidazolonepropionase-like amidohydrolase
MNAYRSLALFGLVTLAGCAPEPPAASTVTHFFGMRLIPGDGSAPIENAGMLVDAGRIVAVGPNDAVQMPMGAAHVDLSGQTIMPLLRSLHVHVGYLKGSAMAAENYSRESIQEDLNRHLHYGVGSVLVLGSDAGDTVFQLRKDQAEGRGSGARLFTVGRGITSVGGWPTSIAAIAAAPQQVETEEQAREAVRGLKAQNVDAVKIWVDDAGGRVPKIAPELYRAAIDEAAKLDLDVFAHVFYLEDAKGLVEAGVSALAHSIRDQEVDDALVAMMKEKDVLYIPTLVAHEVGIAHADGAAWIGEASMRESVAPDVVDALLSEEFVSSARSNPGLASMREQYAVALRNVKKLKDAGVRIGLGTDSGTTHRYPGYFEHRELELLVDAGLSPREAVDAATATSAAVLGQTGTLTEGAPADFLVLASNPLENVANTRDIIAVYVGGKAIERMNRPGADGT